MTRATQRCTRDFSFGPDGIVATIGGSVAMVSGWPTANHIIPFGFIVRLVVMCLFNVYMVARISLIKWAGCHRKMVFAGEYGQWGWCLACIFAQENDSMRK
jgi:hypothetical protein